MTPEEIEQAAKDGEYVDMHAAAKRCGVRWAPWMGDWFVSWSPRNDNDHSEGSWDHWIDLALAILRDPLTELVRPEAHIVELQPLNLYDQTNRPLTDEELVARFATPVTAVDSKPDASLPYVSGDLGDR